MRAFTGKRRRLVWLGLTPDPERLLPALVAALRRQAGDVGATEAAERRRVERLVLHGTQRRWIGYLGEITALVSRVANGEARGDLGLAREVADVVRHHHRMLIGLPGPGHRRTAGQRADLDEAMKLLEGP